MGACASKFKEFKDAAADKVSPPATKEEDAAAVTPKDVKLVQEAVIKYDVPPPATVVEAKSQSLGRLFEEEVKQEFPTVENEKVETGGLNTDEREAGDVKPANEGVENEAPQAEAKAKPAEAMIIKTSEEVETAKTVEADENKADEESGSDKSRGTLEVDTKSEEPSPASEGKKKEIEEKLTQTTKIEEQKLVSDEEDKKVEEKPTETTKTEEEKQVPLEVKPVETMETKEQKPILEEEKKEIEEKPVEVEIQQPVSCVDEEKTKEELAENAKNEKQVYEIEDKRAVEPQKAETAVESKPDEKCVIDEKAEQPEVKNGEHNRVSDGETTKNGEPKAEDI